MTTKPPRIAPLEPSEYTDEMRELVALPRKGFESAKTPDFLATLLRHSGLYRRYAPFAGKLLITGKLPARDREFAILRISWLCQAEFEWGEHVNIAKTVGLTSADIARIMAGPADPGLSDHERAILKAVDEWNAEAMVSDATWAALVQTYDDKLMLELLMLIGAYRMIVTMQNALRIRLHEGNLGLKAR